MAKKMLVTKCRLVKARRWYIDYNVLTESGQIERHRQDFDLNDIEDETTREAVAAHFIKNIDRYAASAKTSPDEVSGPTLRAAVSEALQIKISGPRKNTHKGYKSITNTFLNYASAKGLADAPLNDFRVKQAQAFFDYVKTRRRYKGKTLNNYLIHLRALWGELVRREDAYKNPWRDIRHVREEEKTRRTFTAEERKVVAEYIEASDIWLFRALILQFFCYIRPVEIMRLKGRAFDLDAGTVTVEAYEAKKWKKRVCTIPAAVLPYFQREDFRAVGPNLFVWGARGPGVKPGRDDKHYKAHKCALQYLQKIGSIDDIKGLTWYSWKDTGISLHASKTSALATRDQAGHSDFGMTLTYYKAPTVNGEYRNLTNDLFD